MKTPTAGTLADGNTLDPFADKALRRMGLDPARMTIRDVAALSEQSILSTPGNGRKAFHALRLLIEPHGLRFASEAQRATAAGSAEATMWRGRIRRAIATAARELEDELTADEGGALDTRGQANVLSALAVMLADAGRRALLTEVLDGCGWSLRDASRQLGMSPSSLAWIVCGLGMDEEFEGRGRGDASDQPPTSAVGTAVT